MLCFSLLKLRLLLLIQAAAILPPGATDAGCLVGAGALDLKAADVCDGRRSIVFTETRPLVTFDDWLPATACNLTILVPAQAVVGLFGRLRYMAIRLFRPSTHRLDELRRRSLCLETAFSIRVAPQPTGPAEAPNEEPPPPPLRKHRSCLAPEAADGVWLFEELPSTDPSDDVNGTSSSPTLQPSTSSGLQVQLAWRLVRQPGATVADESAKKLAPPPPIRLAFSVAPFFNCTGATNSDSFVHCQHAAGVGSGLCVPKRLACCSPVVNYLECPKRALFMSSVLDCAFYNHDIGFYLFLVVIGTATIAVILLFLILRPIVASVRNEKHA